MSKGQTVNSRYRLESPLGSGGFSEVWHATDLETGQLVALKLARTGREAEANAKLRHEATILRALNHPNIVRILDSGVDGARDFLVMELIDGPTLRDVLRESGAMSDEDVVAMGAALADALAAAHGMGFVHGDVKPENIIISSGAPYLIDFGTARNLSDTLGPEELRELAGTLAYLAPELLAGEPLSTQSDVYALGVTLYEARSGRLPFAGGGGSLAGSEGRRASPLRNTTSGVDAGLESAIMQSLAIDPAWRPGTAGEVRERLTSGTHDTVQLRPQRGGASTRGTASGSGPTSGLSAATTVTRVPGAGWEQTYRSAFPLFDEWVESEHPGPVSRRRFLAAVAMAALLFLGVFWATTLLWRDSGKSTPSAGRDGSPADGAIASTDTATVTATATTARTPTVTPELPTSAPSATAIPTLEPPSATLPPPTRTPVPLASPATPGNVQQIETQLDTQSGAGRVIQWYDLVVAGRFDDAYALWSDRMKANFPREGNLDARWANTVSVSLNDVRVVSQSGNRMIVAIDFVETLANGTSRRFAGSWQLVASNNGWLLDSPSF